MECVFVWVPIILISHPLQLVNSVEVMGTTLVQTECVHTQATQRGLQALAGMHPRCVLIPLLRPCFVPMLPKSFVQVVCLFLPNSQNGNVSRGGHLYICPVLKHLRPGSKLNQAIKALFGGRSRDQGDLRTAKINRSRMHGCNLYFDLSKIKRPRASEGYDQAIKHTFGQAKSLILVANASTGSI